MCTKLAQLRFHSPRNETCCATRKKRQAQVNAKSHPLQNEPQFLCFCGTSLSLVASHWLRIGKSERARTSFCSRLVSRDSENRTAVAIDAFLHQMMVDAP